MSACSRLCCALVAGPETGRYSKAYGQFGDTKPHCGSTNEHVGGGDDSRRSRYRDCHRPALSADAQIAIIYDRSVLRYSRRRWLIALTFFRVLRPFEGSGESRRSLENYTSSGERQRPRNGRSNPDATRANELGRGQTALAAADLELAFAYLAQSSREDSVVKWADTQT